MVQAPGSRIVPSDDETDTNSKPIEVHGPAWARGILPAPALVSRQWSHALARRSREPSRVAGFIEPASNAHHVVMATSVGFHFEARELGTGRWRHYEVEPGELCVVGAGSAPTELCWESRGQGRSLEVLELYIDPARLREKSRHGGAVSIEPEWRVLRDPLLGELLRGIARELDHPESDMELFGDLATELFAIQLERAHGVSGLPASARRGGLSPFVLQSVREYVAAHLASGIRLPRLASIAGLSPFHFARAFKVSTGLSPHAYVLHCRISLAKKLLSRTTLSIADIARRTGFTSSGQLSSRFRASTGTTPTAFRGLTRR
jgi:AraC family transcriptional regulator